MLYDKRTILGSIVVVPSCAKGHDVKHTMECYRIRVRTPCCKPDPQGSYERTDSVEEAPFQHFNTFPAMVFSSGAMPAIDGPNTRQILYQ